MTFPTESQILVARINCTSAYYSARPGLEALVLGIDELINTGFLEVVEHSLLPLKSKVRRLLSHYGAVGGCSAAHEWREKSFDAMNVIYSSAWEYWKGEANISKFPSCKSITHWNTAGNVVEALLGVAWIHLHLPEGHYLDAIYVSDAEQKQAWEFVRAWGPTCQNRTLALEHAIMGMRSIWEACPWIQIGKAHYDHELMQSHLEALRLGFHCGAPFHARRLPVFPAVMHGQVYNENVAQQIQCELEKEFSRGPAPDLNETFRAIRRLA